MHVPASTRIAGELAGVLGATGLPAPARTPARPTGAERSFRATLLAEQAAATKPATATPSASTAGTAPAQAGTAPPQAGTTPGTARTPDTTPATTAAAATGAAAKAPRAPKGERTEAVEGHRYAEIVAGPRNGMHLNTSGNARDGQAFTLVERGGFHFHVYGTGRDRQVFRVPDRDDDAGGARATAPPRTAGAAARTIA